MEPKLRVLIVEDNDAMSKILQLFLLPHTPHIQIRQTGQDGLDEIGQGQTDVVLLDVRLPDMSGVDVLTRLQTAAGVQPVPVVTMTAYDYDADELLAGGAVAHIPKNSPDFSSAEKLWSILCRAAERHQGRPTLTGDESLLLRRLVAGEPIRAIARELKCSRRTAYRKLDKLREQFGVNTAKELVAQAIRLGIVD